MSNQPANSSIKIYRAVRAQREYRLTDTVKTKTAGLRAFSVVVPGAENHKSMALTRDNSLGISDYDRTGRPIVVGARGDTSLDTILDADSGLDGIGFPVRVGNDLIITNSETGVDDATDGDLFGRTKAVAGL